MKFSVPNKEYLSYKTCKEMHELTTGLFGNFPITAFSFARIYDDGTCFGFSNNRNLIEYYFSNAIPISATVPVECVRDRFYFLVPQNDSYEMIYRDLSHFKVGNFFDILHKKHNYVELFDFSTAEAPADAANFYLNNLERLDRFACEFTEKNKLLISKACQDRLLLPNVMRPSFQEKAENRVSSETQNRTLILGNQKVSFTKREFDCLKRIVVGKTAKQIATELNISIRTVEYYIFHIKQKLTCKRKSEIVELLLDYRVSIYSK